MRRFCAFVAVLAFCAVASPARAAGPTAIGVDSAGVVYVGFANGGMIKRYAGSDGSPLAPWGTAGSAPGQLGGVVAIDVAPGGSGNVWILDTNRRVQEFTRAGQYVRGIQLGTCGGAITPNPLQRGGLDVSNDSVYVAHPCDNSLLRLRLSDLQTQATASPTAPKGLSAQLYGTAPANTNALYVAQPSLNQVSILQPQFFSQQGTKSTPGPSDVFVDAFGVLFAPDVVNNLIHLYGSDGNEFRTLGRPGSNAGDLNNPTAIDVFEQFSDLAGNIFIADYGNNRIQRWSSGGFTFWTAPADDSTGGPVAPVNTAAPQIQGTPTQGQTVTCTQGTWTNSPTGYSFVWQRNGSPIGGATSSSYVIQAADVGQNLTCVVTASNAAGSGQASSAAVVPVASVQAPVNQTRPVISGTAAVGNVLSCSQGTWTNSPTGYAYAWTRNGSTVVGSASSYTVQAADAGQVLTCSVTASNAAGATTAVSDPVTVSTPGCTGGTTGVSINAAAQFTTSVGVILTIHEPAGATSVVISNDGGFATPTTQAIRCDDTYSWTLAASTSGRLPKTVYVRFAGPGIDADKTFTDDIVFDSSAPALTSATLQKSATSGYVLKLAATDRGSGVAKVQVASSRSARRVQSRAYKSRLSVRYRATTRFARVIDRAGNVGRWRAVRMVQR